LVEQPSEADFAQVVARIHARYANPARKAHAYLFRVGSAAALEVLLPSADDLLAAWIDEGHGLHPLPPAEALARCQAALNSQPPRRTQQQMARAASFCLGSTIEADQTLIVADLVSRSLHYTPKGDRRVRELWQTAAGDSLIGAVGAERIWFSKFTNPDTTNTP
jgi:hypothetical protein